MKEFKYGITKEYLYNLFKLDSKTKVLERENFRNIFTKDLSYIYYGTDLLNELDGIEGDFLYEKINSNIVETNILNKKVFINLDVIIKLAILFSDKEIEGYIKKEFKNLINRSKEILKDIKNFKNFMI